MLAWPINHKARIYHSWKDSIFNMVLGKLDIYVKDKIRYSLITYIKEDQMIKT